jgi:regulatory protein YycH of two-component signal transduction system YycFG
MSEDEIVRALKTLNEKIDQKLQRPSKAILYSKDILLAVAAITVIVFLWAIPVWKTGVDNKLCQNEKDHVSLFDFVKEETKAMQQVTNQLTVMKATDDEREKLRAALASREKARGQ